MRERAIGNGIDFHDFGIRNSIDFRNFCHWFRAGMHFRKIGIKSGIHFGKNGMRNGYVIETSMARPRSKSGQSPPPGLRLAVKHFHENIVKVLLSLSFIF